MIKSQVKYIQSLSHKKQRDEDDVFIAEGPKIVEELILSSNTSLVGLYALESWAALHPDVPAEVIQPHELAKISTLQTPHQVLGIFKKPVFDHTDDYTNRLIIMLDSLQDPGNLGTIIRCADWFGIDTIIASPNSADAFNSKVVQSTMGSISRVEVIYEDLTTFMARHSGLSYYAAALNGRPLQEIAPLNNGVIMIGNESKGLDPALLEKATHRITIPRKGKAESLNAAVATGIILSQLTMDS